MPSRPERLLAHGAGLALGAVGGVLGSFVHPLRPGGLPLGLLGALALTAAGCAAARLLAGSRSGGAAAALGWLAPVLLLSAPRPEGDLVVPGTGAGYAWLVGGTVVAGLAVAWPSGPAAATGVSSGHGAGGR